MLPALGLVIASASCAGDVSSGIGDTGATEGTNGAADDADAGDDDGDDDDGGSEPGGPECGNGMLELGEGCDLGPANDDAGKCTTACQPWRCGDGLVGPGEGCDDGNDVDTDGCSLACVPASCGDGVLQEGEACDDGNEVDTDDCTTACTLPTCGDGHVQGDEPCDDGDAIEGNGCNTDCKVSGSVAWTWSENLSMGEVRTSTLLDSSRAPDGSLYLCSLRLGVYGGSQLVVTKLDTGLNVEWEYDFPGGYAPACAANNTGVGVVRHEVDAFQMKVSWIDDDGQLQWTAPIGAWLAAPPAAAPNLDLDELDAAAGQKFRVVGRLQGGQGRAMVEIDQQGAAALVWSHPSGAWTPPTINRDGVVAWAEQNSTVISSFRPDGTARPGITASGAVDQLAIDDNGNISAVVRTPSAKRLESWDAAGALRFATVLTADGLDFDFSWKRYSLDVAAGQDTLLTATGGNQDSHLWRVDAAGSVSKISYGVWEAPAAPGNYADEGHTGAYVDSPTAGLVVGLLASRIDGVARVHPQTGVTTLYSATGLVPAGERFYTVAADPANGGIVAAGYGAQYVALSSDGHVTQAIASGDALDPTHLELSPDGNTARLLQVRSPESVVQNVDLATETGPTIVLDGTPSGSDFGDVVAAGPRTVFLRRIGDATVTSLDYDEFGGSPVEREFDIGTDLGAAGKLIFDGGAVHILLAYRDDGFFEDTLHVERRTLDGAVIWSAEFVEEELRGSRVFVHEGRSELAVLTQERQGSVQRYGHRRFDLSTGVELAPIIYGPTLPEETTRVTDAAMADDGTFVFLLEVEGQQKRRLMKMGLDGYFEWETTPADHVPFSYTTFDAVAVMPGGRIAVVGGHNEQYLADPVVVAFEP